MSNRQLILVVFFLSLVPLEFGRLSVVGDPPNVLITGFFSCDRRGVSMNFFPIKTTVYFHVSLRNFASAPLNMTVSVSVLDVTGVPVGMDQLKTTILCNSTAYYIMSVFLPKWTRLGLATAYATVFAEGECVDGETTRFYTSPEDLTPPTVTILSPENVTYSESHSVPLVFTVNERPFWMSYKLNELGNITIEGNSTLASLVNNDYNLVVYVNDGSGNVGSSQVNFTVLVVHDVAVTDVQCSHQQTYVGQPVSISVSVQNEGTTSETFNVSVHANATLIGTLLVDDFPGGDDTTLPLTWNTADIPKGNYTITVVASSIPEETDTADNTFEGSWVFITIPGDVDADRRVDVFDLVRISYLYQTSQTQNPLYEPNCDINGDGNIDIYDLTITASHYGEEW